MASRRRLVMWTRALVVIALLSTAVLSFSGQVARADVRFGPSDVATVFYVSKSDDRNRVDYGVRLDAQCRPVGERPVFTYWRRFEPNQPPIGKLNRLDERAYGIVWQRVSARRIVMKLRALAHRPITIVAAKSADGTCEAHAETTISGGRARLDRVFVQLAGFLRVDYVEVHGSDLRTRAPMREVIRE